MADAATPQNSNPEPPDIWREEVQKTAKQRDEFKNKYTDAASKLAAFEAKEANEAAEKASRKEREEQQKMIDEGKTKELLKMTDEKWKGQISAKEQEFVNELIPLYIQAAATQIPNLIKGSEKDLAKLLRDDYRRENGKLVVYENGKPKVNEDGSPYDPYQYIVDQTKIRPHMLMDQMPASYGAPRDASPRSTAPKSIAEADDKYLTKAIDNGTFKDQMTDFSQELIANAKAKGRAKREARQ